ncbi:DUF7287 family protein [Methanocella sp. MCL-LM]|uniref:DUF7287 family protein n=1 Tax=Methanocella sp. MCL-LM TaxID=3412035 RepID=UPI003C71072A
MTRGIDHSGQSNLDFLIGSAIFLMAFIYVIAFVPGLFVPYQAGAVDLGSVAYKTCAVLVEDPGWYTWQAGTDTYGDPGWENHVDQVTRIGLANDRMSPNVLSMNKIKALNKINDYDLVGEKVGLNGTITYDYTLSLTMKNELSQMNVPLLYKSGAEKNNNVEYMERNVLVDTGKQLFVDCGLVTGDTSLLDVNLSNRIYDPEENVTIRIFNTPGNNTFLRVMYAYDNASPYTPYILNKDYYLYKNGSQQLSVPFNFTNNDTVEVVVNSSSLYNSIGDQYVQLIQVRVDEHVSKPFPPAGAGYGIDYAGNSTYMLQNVCYPGLFKIEVWSNEI